MVLPTAGYVAFWVLLGLALGAFAWRVAFLVRLLRLGRAEAEDRFARPVPRLVEAALSFVTQKSNLRHLALSDLAPLGHALMFWGLGVFLIGYFVFLGLGMGLGLLPLISGSRFERSFLSALDLAGLLVLGAMFYVIVKRYLLKPRRLERRETTGEKIAHAGVVAVIVMLVVLHYLIEALGYAGSDLGGNWPPLGAALAGLLIASSASPQALEAAAMGLWWFNYLLVLGALVYAPHSKHLHPLFILPNLIFRQREQKGAPQPVDLKDTRALRREKVNDLTWKQLLDSYACTWCGRCHVRCPAQLSGKPLSPRELLLGIKDHLLKVGPSLLGSGRGGGRADMTGKIRAAAPESGASGEEAASSPRGSPLVGTVISEEGVWACTTCLACQEVCPAANEQMRIVVDLRRHLQMIATTETARETVKNLRVRGHPWRGTTYARTDWAEGLDVKILGEDGVADLLYWVGCTQALEDRNLKVARSVARLLKEAGIDFAILGEEETCCGDPARRLGAEHIFQMLAQANVRLLVGHGVRRIVTACPHCYQVLKNEYPALGGWFEVQHHSQFLAELLRGGGLELGRLEQRHRVREKGSGREPAGPTRMTYHDGCYLGRYNGLYEPPRELLRQVPDAVLVEMVDNRGHGLCCGGGGGRIWLEETAETRVSSLRLAQVLETGASVLATACPFCLLMLDDAVRSQDAEDVPRVKDIAEILAELVGGSSLPDHHAG